MLNFAKTLFHRLFRWKPVTGNKPSEYQIPSEYGNDIQLSESIGRSIYLLDKAVAIASETAMIKEPLILERLAVMGYVVTGVQGEDQSTKGFVVHFYTEKVEVTLPLEVFVPFASGKPSEVHEHDPPAIPSHLVRTMINARKAALVGVEPPRQATNSVVLSAAEFGESGYLVYLLAASSNPGLIVLGRHLRCLISDEGELSRVDTLSSPVWEMKRPSEGHLTAITCRTSEHPLETHVFTSLLEKISLFVVCNGNHQWRIDGGRVSYLGRSG